MSRFRIHQTIFLILLLLEVNVIMGQKDEDSYQSRQEQAAIFKLQFTDAPHYLLVTYIPAGGLVTVAIYFLISYVNLRWKRFRRHKYFERNGGNYLPPSPHEEGHHRTVFDPEEIEISTAFFSSKRLLGKGGQGTVYDGMLEDGRLVAIKIANKVSTSLRESFINEALVLTDFVHDHIIKLFGFCLHTEKPILVYDYIEAKTLQDYIHNKDEFNVSWDVMQQVITSVAGALDYIHTYDRFAVYHRDVKPANILLDEDNKVYLADFGLAKLNESRKADLMLSKVEGTNQFICPEVLKTWQYNDKSDVYSFGMVMVEMLTGDSVYNDNLKKRFFKAVDENDKSILDSRITMLNNEDTVWRVAQLAQMCIRKERKKRPTMAEVLDMLKGGQIEESLRDYTEVFTESSDSSASFPEWDFSSSDERLVV